MSEFQSLEQRIENMSEKNRRIDNFHTTFLGIPENIANILGRQVKSFTRPTFDYLTVDQMHRGNVYKDKQKLTFTPASIAFYDDEQSITATFLYMQLYRQQNKHTDKFGKFGMDRDYRFDIKLETFNAVGQVTEGIIMRGCFIQNINHSDPVIMSSEDCEIMVSFECDNIDILLFDEYVSFTRG